MSVLTSLSLCTNTSYTVLYLRGVFHQESLDKVFGHGAGRTEIMIVKLVAQGDDVVQGFLISFPLERRQTTQSEQREREGERESTPVSVHTQEAAHTPHTTSETSN